MQHQALVEEVGPDPAHTSKSSSTTPDKLSSMVAIYARLIPQISLIPATIEEDTDAEHRELSPGSDHPIHSLPQDIFW